MDIFADVTLILLGSALCLFLYVAMIAFLVGAAILVIEILWKIFEEAL